MSSAQGGMRSVAKRAPGGRDNHSLVNKPRRCYVIVGVIPAVARRGELDDAAKAAAVAIPTRLSAHTDTLNLGGQARLTTEGWT